MLKVENTRGLVSAFTDNKALSEIAMDNYEQSSTFWTTSGTLKSTKNNNQQTTGFFFFFWGVGETHGAKDVDKNKSKAMLIPVGRIL